MKKRYLILTILITLLFPFVVNASQYKVNDQLTFSYSKVATSSIIKWKREEKGGSDYQYNTYKFTFKDTNNQNKDIVAYCVDPGFQNAKDTTDFASQTNTNVYIKEILNNADGAAFLSILESNNFSFTQDAEMAMRYWAFNKNYSRNVDKVYTREEIEANKSFYYQQNDLWWLYGYVFQNVNAIDYTGLTAHYINVLDKTKFDQHVSTLKTTIAAAQKAYDEYDSNQSSVVTVTPTATIDTGKTSGKITYKIKALKDATLDFEIATTTGVTVTSDGCNWQGGKCSGKSIQKGSEYTITATVDDVCSTDKLTLKYTTTATQKNIYYLQFVENSTKFQGYIGYADDTVTESKTSDATFDNDTACANAKYCIKKDGSYYKCSQNTYSSDTSICTKYNSSTDAQKDITDKVTSDISCFKTATQYCVQNGSYWDICPTTVYSTSCQQVTNKDDVKAKITAGTITDVNCVTPTKSYCYYVAATATSAEKYYACPSADTSASALANCEQFDYNIKDKVSTNINCPDPGTSTDRVCHYESSHYYDCLDGSIDINDTTKCTPISQSDATTKIANNTLKAGNCNSSGVKTCVYNNYMYYLCTDSTTYDASKCSTLSSSATSANTILRNQGITSVTCDEPDEDEDDCENKFSNDYQGCDDFKTKNKMIPNSCESKDGNYEYNDTFDSTSSWDSKVCKKTDEFGNSLENTSATLDDGSLAGENSFCSVYCTESYKFSYPYKKSTKSGRYVNIDLKINNAEETCYLVTNTDKFKEQHTKVKTEIEKEIQNYENLTKPEVIAAYINTPSNYYEYEEKHESECISEAKASLYASYSSSCVVGSENYATCITTAEGLAAIYGQSQGSTKYNTVYKPEAQDDAREHYLETVVNSSYNKIEVLQKDLENIDKEYSSCSGFTFDANILDEDQLTAKYSYNEPYNSKGVSYNTWMNQIKLLNGDVLETKDSIDFEDKTKLYGVTGNDDYNQSSQVYDTTTYKRIECSKSDDNLQLNCDTNIEVKVPLYPNEKYSKGLKSEVEYTTPRIFYNIYTNGDVYISKTAPTDSKNKTYTVVDGIPIGFETPQGNYPYSITFEGLGTYFATGETGRIYGNANSVAKQLNDFLKGESCNNDAGEDLVSTGTYACTYDVTDGSATGYCKKDGETYYICSKDVSDFKDNTDVCSTADKDEALAVENIGDCDDGETYCYQSGNTYYMCSDDPRKDGDLSSCTPTTKYIAGCAQNKGNCTIDTHICKIKNDGGKIVISENNSTQANQDHAVSFKTISTSSVFPNSTYTNPSAPTADAGADTSITPKYNFGSEVSYNWNWKSENILVAQKAYNTIVEIEARAEDYESEATGETNENDVNTTITVTLDRDAIELIKEFNANHKSYDSSDTLNCYDYILKTANNEPACDAQKDAGFVWEDNECKMKNIFCYSILLDELQTNGKITSNRPSSEGNRGDISSVSSDITTIEYLPYSNTDVSSSSYGTIENIQDYWTIYRYTTLDVVGDNDGLADIGPSWK